MSGGTAVQQLRPSRPLGDGSHALLDELAQKKVAPSLPAMTTKTAPLEGMLDSLAIATCPAVFTAALVSTFLLDRPPQGFVLTAALLAGGFPISVLAALSHVGVIHLSPLATLFSSAMGPATVAGAWLAARVFRPA